MSKITIGHQIVDSESIKDKRDKDNFYPTPIPFIEWLLNTVCETHPNISVKLGYLLNHNDPSVLDVGVGTGHWGQVFSRKTSNIFGVEKNFNRFYTHPETNWDSYVEVIGEDILKHIDRYDIVLGNPPYMRTTKKVSGTTQIINHILDYNLQKNGIAMFLLPSNFRHGTKRNKLFTFNKYPSVIIDIANRINFKDPSGKKGSYPGEYAVFIWQNDGKDREAYKGYRMEWS